MSTRYRQRGMKGASCVLPHPDVLARSINHDCIAPVLDNTKRARAMSTLGQRVIIFVTNRRLRRVNLRARVYDFVTAYRSGERATTNAEPSPDLRLRVARFISPDQVVVAGFLR